MMIRSSLLGLSLVATVTRGGTAQAHPVRVTGLVYDSVAGKPLSSAFVSIIGGGRNTTTDVKGRFQFDSVEAGTYRFAMQHAVLDSMGLTGFVSRAVVGDGRDRAEVVIALPSFATLWRTACAGPVPRDSGFVYGTIHDAGTGKPAGGANVEISWSDIVLDEAKGVTRRRWRSQTRSDSTGTYSLCGIPNTALGLRMQATSDSLASGLIELPPREVRVQRRDLHVGRFEPDSLKRGVVRGVLTDNEGKLLAGVRVLMDGVPEAKSDVDGEFLLRDVPTGTRQLEVLSGGTLISTVLTVEVAPGDTVVLTPRLGRIAPKESGLIGGRRLSIVGEEFIARRRTGVGVVVDSADIVRRRSVSASLAAFPNARLDVVNGDPTLTLVGENGSCIPDVKIDDYAAGYGHLRGLYATEVAAMELYPRADGIPKRFQPRTGHPCALLLVWTKSAFK
ncbi:MAG TPA: carboxypeptidase regulatory-like domain-containing protein [Gemmatimonadaceae bacterium]|nr:carboxypeptidase regulatory-like domain-containing protein [Gemmatimonadaceae bacterium]